MSAVVTVQPTTDESYIKSVFLNPTVYSKMADDSCPTDPWALRDVNIMAIPGFFLRAMVDGVDAGCWWLMWKGDKVEAHTALLENCRGRVAIEATKKAIEWVFANTRAVAITSYAWSDTPAVKWFCRAVGMKATETRKWPATRGGHEVDITFYEIGRAA